MRVIGSTKQNKPFIVGVAGGSGSGKTYFAQSMLKLLGEDSCALVYQDNFYHDQSKRFDFDGGAVNFDHPDSIDFSRLANCLGELKSGNNTQIPIYDFVTHTRKKETLQIKPHPVILVDGILIFHSEPVRAHFDELIFFDTSEELRFRRRLKRDMEERGRLADGVKSQFFNQVKPMHDQFVEPSKKYAGSIVSDSGDFAAVLEAFAWKLKGVCEKNG